jgi:hypothetical protein
VLGVSSSYYEVAYKCIFEIGVKLAHVIWRKLLPDDLVKADCSLNTTCYNLLSNEEYDLVIILLEFATGVLKQYSNEEMRLMFIINLCQAYKWSGHQEKCIKLLKKNDWSACSNSFKLASKVLEDDFLGAATIMQKIGINGDVRKVDYADWPLFKAFRKTEDFSSTYKEVFGEDFICTEESMTIDSDSSANALQEVAVTKEE